MLSCDDRSVVGDSTRDRNHDIDYPRRHKTVEAFGCNRNVLYGQILFGEACKIVTTCCHQWYLGVIIP